MGRYGSGVRIIGGRWGGRRIPVADIPGLRPTSDRIRETVFNWLQPQLKGALCLDLFAGSGALAFEALSRGASGVVAVDSRREVAESLHATRSLLGADALEVVRERAERFLVDRAGRRFDVVFIDPPFDLELHKIVCELLQRNGWLSDAALIYVEAALDGEPRYPRQWRPLKRARAGKVSYGLLQAGVVDSQSALSVRSTDDKRS